MERYQPLVVEGLRRAGIPLHSTRGSRRPDVAGRSFLALLQFVRETGADHGPIIPTPYLAGVQGIPSLPGIRRHGQEDGPLWYFRGVPLVLDVFPGTSRAGRDPEAKRSTGNTRGPRSPGDHLSRVTGRDARHLLA